MKGKTSVTAEDQLQINRFARQHKCYLETKIELNLINTEIQNLNYAADELLLLDDEDLVSIPFQIGSVFVHYDQDSINEKLEKAKDEATQRSLVLQDELKKFDEELKELRRILYAKFGDNIQLDMESDD